MSDKLTAIKIKYPNGTYSEQILLSVLAENVQVNSNTTLSDALDLIDTRIDQIVAPTGSTSALDAEIFDARIGVDGTDHGNLGDAIRNQINGLETSTNNEISDLKSAFNLILSPELVDYTNISVSHYSIASTNKWTYGSTQDSYTYSIPSQVKKITVKGHSSNGSIIAFLNTYNPETGTIADFSQKYPTRIVLDANETKQFFIDENTKYFFALLKNTSSENKTPQAYFYYLAIDKTLLQPNKIADAKAVGDKFNQFEQYNLIDNYPKGKTVNGITWTLVENGAYKLKGTSSGTSFIAFFSSPNSFPSWWDPNEQYYLIFNGDEKVRFGIFYYTTEGLVSTSLISITYTTPEEGVPVKLPSNATGMIIMLSIPSDFTFDESYFYKPIIISEKTARNKKYLNSIYKYNSIDIINASDFYFSSVTRYGVTYTKEKDNFWHVEGTSTGNSFFNLISGSSSLPDFIKPGISYSLKMHGGTIPLQIFFYNGEGSTNTAYTSDANIVFPEDLTGIIVRFRIPQGRTVNETVRYELISNSLSQSSEEIIEGDTYIYNNEYNITTSPTITTDSNGWLQAIDTNTESESGKTDMTGPIMSMLNDTGYCHLGEGIFYVSGNIDMPTNSMIQGCGKNTIIKLLNSTTSGYCIKMKSYNTLSNLQISGAYNTPTLTTQGSRCGILFAANNDGQEGSSAYSTNFCMINNVWIENFTDSGIKCHNTSISVNRGIYATNLYIHACWCGLNIDYRSEFHKFVNLQTHSCVYGCINNGGNNVFSSCTFHATEVGFYIDGTQNNAAHGSMVGCTFCHVGSNNGIAFKANDIDPGFIIADCQFWYCSIEVINCQGILFNSCVFGRGINNDGSVSASITINGGNLVLFNGCVFHLDVQRPPRITITNNSKVRFSECYGSESGSLITA